MNTKQIRFTLTIPNDMVQKAEILKKNIFYDKPYSEMYRQLIQLGIDKFQQEKQEKNENNQLLQTT